MPAIVVQVYDASWPDQFTTLKQTLWPAVSDLATAVEHVGSTSVPGLAAKPIIDLDLIIASSANLAPIIARLQNLGYEHRGNLGIEGRDAFRAPSGPIAHNLYVCLVGNTALQNHLKLRDRLRKDPEVRNRYSALKFDLAKKFPDSIDDYLTGKTAFILALLNEEGLTPAQLETIRLANTAPPKVYSSCQK